VNGLQVSLSAGLGAVAADWAIQGLNISRRHPCEAAIEPVVMKTGRQAVRRRGSKSRSPGVAGASRRFADADQ